ncbi:NAD(P)H-quinone oxidoreductase subunit 5, chloroplastic [Phlyctochytrium bullatum]|nr:NAD(P)H-quinone oxidoreductase subunit 5, chloroplastic [Phlyctochytrium bullatum]
MPSPAPATDSVLQLTVDTLPLEVGRRILLHLPPIDILTLSAVSREMRRLFRPADTELQFATDHLLMQFPELRGIVADAFEDSDMEEAIREESDDDEESEEGGEAPSVGSDDDDASDDDDEVDNGICAHENLNVSGSGHGDIDEGASVHGISAHGEANGDDENNDDHSSLSEQGSADSESDDSEEEDDEGHLSNKKTRLSYRVANDLLKKRIRGFQRLPVCYALAVLKIQDFTGDAIGTVTFTEKKRHSSHRDDNEKPRKVALFERILLVGVCKFGLGFKEVEYEWEGRWYRRKEAYAKIRIWIGMTGSIEAARFVIETEKNSVKMLPSDYVGEKRKHELGTKTHIWCKGDPRDVSESIQNMAFEACMVGKVPLLRFLLDTYPTCFTNLAASPTHRNKNTYLHAAFAHGQEEAMRTLVDYMKRSPYGEETVSADSPPKYNPALSLVERISGQSFIRRAAYDGNAAMVRLLLELGADPNFVAPCRTGSSFFAVGLVGLFFSIIGGDYSDDTPALHSICSSGPVELIPLLVAHGANPFQRAREGYTALMDCRTPEAVKALVEAVMQYTPHVLHDLLVAKCDREKNALHRAIEQQNKEVVRALLEAVKKAAGDDRGWELKKAVFGSNGRFQQTALHRACVDDQGGNTNNDTFSVLVLDAMMDSVERDTTTFEELRSMLLMGDNEDYTPVHVAASLGRETTLRMMLQLLTTVDDGMCKKVLNVRAGKKQRTPLHSAAGMGSLGCIQILLEHGADPGMKDADGNTPLMLAEQEKWEESARVLREVTPKEAPPAGRKLAVPKSRRKSRK